MPMASAITSARLAERSGRGTPARDGCAAFVYPLSAIAGCGRGALRPADAAVAMFTTSMQTANATIAMTATGSPMLPTAISSARPEARSPVDKATARRFPFPRPATAAPIARASALLLSKGSKGRTGAHHPMRVVRLAMLWRTPRSGRSPRPDSPSSAAGQPARAAGSRTPSRSPACGSRRGARSLVSPPRSVLMARQLRQAARALCRMGSMTAGLTIREACC
jgi:hypothetical protein